MQNAKCKMQKGYALVFCVFNTLIRNFSAKKAIGKVQKGCALVFCIFNFAFCILSGCTQQQQTALEKQVEQGAGAVKTAAEKTAAQALRDTTASAAKTWANTTKNATQGGAALRVKSALALSTRLDGASIDVDLQGNRLILSGEAITVTQKSVAESIAKNTVDPKFRVVNRLKVAGPKTASKTH